MVATPPMAEIPLLTRLIGDIISFRIFGQVVVVLNSAKIAKDLFEKRAAIYSDRSPMPMYDMWVLDSVMWTSAFQLNPT